MNRWAAKPCLIRSASVCLVVGLLCLSGGLHQALGWQQERLRWTKDYIYRDGQLVATTMRSLPGEQHPVIDRVVPRVVVQGSVVSGSTLTLTLYGALFRANSVVNFAGMPVESVWTDSTRMQGKVPAGLVWAGDKEVRVTTPAVRPSNAVTVTVLGTPSFADVPANYWAVNFIESIFADQITTGCETSPVRRYCPDSPVTRGQMAVFVLRAMKLKPLGPQEVEVISLADVPRSHLFWGFIQRFYQLGITTGCEANPPRYCPDDPVSREQMAAFLCRSLGYSKLESQAVYFSDVAPTSWAWGYIQRIAQLGITSGCDVNKYCPNDPVRRDQMARFLTAAF